MSDADFTPKELLIVHEPVWDMIVDTLATYDLRVTPIPSSAPGVVDSYCIRFPN